MACPVSLYRCARLECMRGCAYIGNWPPPVADPEPQKVWRCAKGWTGADCQMARMHGGGHTRCGWVDAPPSDPEPQKGPTAEQLSAAILDIDAHATPLGTDSDGFTTNYILTAGALHRALGLVGHTAPPAVDAPPSDPEPQKVWRCRECGDSLVYVNGWMHSAATGSTPPDHAPAPPPDVPGEG